MREAVERLFDKRLRQKFSVIKEAARDELLRAAYHHERKPICIDNIVHQLRLLKLQRQMTKNNFVDIVFSSADMYCSAVLENLKQSILTQAERQRRINEANRISDIEAEFDAEQKDLLDPTIKSFPGAPARRGLVLA